MNFECFNCKNMNKAQVATGHNNPENKGKKYFKCAKCHSFNMEENIGDWSDGEATHPSGMKADYSKTPGRKDPSKDPEAEGKVRHGISVAYIERGEQLTEQVKSDINDWVEFIMTGK